MSQINISSKNQSGGITAHSVGSGSANISTGGETPKPKGRGAAFWFKTVTAILASMASIAAAIHWV